MGEGEERMTEPWGPALKIFLRETPRTRWVVGYSVEQSGVSPGSVA